MCHQTRSASTNQQRIKSEEGEQVNNSEDGGISNNSTFKEATYSLFIFLEKKHSKNKHYGIIGKALCITFWEKM